MTASEARPEYRLCSLVSKANGDDPIGSASSFERYLIVEVKEPWEEDVTHSRHFPRRLLEISKRAAQRGVVVRVMGMAPDSEHSREGYTRLLHLYKADDLFAIYEKDEFVVPDDDLLPLVKVLLGEETEFSRFEPYRERSSHVRDLLVCTHRQRDVCCGKFGHPIYETLRHHYAADSRNGLRVWRVSHIGGHRFAPTLIDFPEGRYWGHLEQEALENLVFRNGPVSELRRFYRGWGGLGFFEQIVERDIFVREGWKWTEYRKVGQVLGVDQEKDRAEVRIDYVSPDYSSRGAYEATVEFTGSVITLGSSGTGALNEVKQYRVNRLQEIT